jgi:LmbE family N-acetylglucosaminyl deacetylase
VGAHYDDIELNCLGTLLKAKEQGAKVWIIVCTDGAMGGDSMERLKEQSQVNRLIKYNGWVSMGLPDGALKHNSDLVRRIENVMELDFKPNYIITHTEKDFHQDHIAVAKAVKSANRSASASLITFPSQDIKQPFTANLFVDITKYFDTKLEIIKHFKSQLGKPWLQEDTIIARNLGTGVAKYVEKFHIEFLKL